MIVGALADAFPEEGHGGWAQEQLAAGGGMGRSVGCWRGTARMYDEPAKLRDRAKERAAIDLSVVRRTALTSIGSPRCGPKCRNGVAVCGWRNRLRRRDRCAFCAEPAGTAEGLRRRGAQGCTGRRAHPPNSEGALPRSVRGMDTMSGVGPAQLRSASGFAPIGEKSTA